MEEPEKLLEVHNLSKVFGRISALVDVNFSLAPGEVLGVVGQRGSGKSTLFRLLGGVYTISSGEIYYQGKRLTIHTPSETSKLGIEVVYQNPQMAENMDVFQNVFLGREIKSIKGLNLTPDVDGMFSQARKLFSSLDAPEDLLTKQAADLSGEERQIVALARAFSKSFNLLMLDDPLPSLSFTRQKLLLKYIKDYAAKNISVILSSDDLRHIFAVTDRILVLYQGNQVALRVTSETTPREIVELIVGSKRQEQVTPVIWAIENYFVAQKQAEDLRRVQKVLKQSLEEQDSLNRQLIDRLGAQLEALNRLNLALQEANRRSLSEREAERKALARDLHDQVIQDLLSYNYLLEEVEEEAEKEGYRGDIMKIRNGIREVVGSLRQICSDLRPPTIDNHGLSAAIRSLTHQWADQTGITVHLDMDPNLGRLPETIELSVFRIIQEGLSNVRKHSNASVVNLALKRSPTASLVVELLDNGQGIEKPINLAELSDEKHFGLVGISERVTLLGGTMQVSTPKDKGMKLSMEIPSPYPTIETVI